MNFTEEKIDWTPYIERRNSVFYVCIFNTVYGTLLRDLTGFGFKYQLYAYKNGVYTFYKSQRELDKCKEYFLAMLRQSPDEVENLYEECRKVDREELGLVKKFSKNLKTEDLILDYNSTISQLTRIFAYLSTIPMMFLDAIDSIPESERDERLKGYEKKFLLFRRRSRNLLQPLILEKFWQAGADLTNIKEFIDLSFVTPDELGLIFKHGIGKFGDEIRKRKAGCVFYENPKNHGIFFSYDRNFLEKVGVKKEKIDQMDSFKGMVASPGIARGRVSILNKPVDLLKFQEGDIVVSVNTTPSLMPALIKCAGIVTDEGGLTCHAAIIARELKKPCIIGTKIATKILKDGDIIEVDANSGFVRKLRSK